MDIVLLSLFSISAFGVGLVMGRFQNTLDELRLRIERLEDSVLQTSEYSSSSEEEDGELEEEDEIIVEEIDNELEETTVSDQDPKTKEELFQSLLSNMLMGLQSGNQDAVLADSVNQMNRLKVKNPQLLEDSEDFAISKLTGMGIHSVDQMQNILDVLGEDSKVNRNLDIGAMKEELSRCKEELIDYTETGEIPGMKNIDVDFMKFLKEAREEARKEKNN